MGKQDAVEKLAHLIDKALYYAGQGVWPLPDPDGVSQTDRSSFAQAIRAVIDER